MRRGDWAHDAEAIRAEAVDTIIRVAVLVGLGVPACTVYRRCREDGPWTLMAPATVRLGTGTPTRRQLVRAALVYAGDRAALTGLDAARAHRLRRGVLPEPVHLLIPAAVKVQSIPGVRVERTHRMPPVRERDGLPVAPMERCLVDAARRMSSRSDVAAILTEPVQRRMLLPSALHAEVEAGSTRGSALPRAVLRAIAAGARSAAEVDFHDWWFAQPELAGVAILFNVRLSVGGVFLGIADGYLPDIGAVLPVDSVEQHFMTPDQVIETERQHRRYRSVGLHVYGLRPGRIHGDSTGLLRDVLDAIAVAEQLPTPTVAWVPDLPRAT
ncbi:hypothetical protein [Actinomycetospora chiangmaiensis]|uniref:hypothetical protein n=1 Tax=Actinomycetospora chiangmaiensis TaxID=402650 RepID=UPI00035D96DA|nr:hypothetical protein [Actinomycetospora chiangmaiensis]